jgi:hypothetical protein
LLYLCACTLSHPWPLWSPLVQPLIAMSVCANAHNYILHMHSMVFYGLADSYSDLFCSLSRCMCLGIHSPFSPPTLLSALCCRATCGDGHQWSPCQLLSCQYHRLYIRADGCDSDWHWVHCQLHVSFIGRGNQLPGAWHLSRRGVGGGQLTHNNHNHPGSWVCGLRPAAGFEGCGPGNKWPPTLSCSAQQACFCAL